MLSSVRLLSLSFLNSSSFHSLCLKPCSLFFRSINLTARNMSAIFNFQSLLTVVLLLICTCTFIHAVTPSILDRNKTGLTGMFWKCARIGERKSPWVAACCIAMAFNILFFQWFNKNILNHQCAWNLGSVLFYVTIKMPVKCIKHNIQHYTAKYLWGHTYYPNEKSFF